MRVSAVPTVFFSVLSSRHLIPIVEVKSTKRIAEGANSLCLSTIVMEPLGFAPMLVRTISRRPMTHFAI